MEIPPTEVKHTTAADSASIASASAAAGFVPTHKNKQLSSAPGSPTVKFTRIFAKNTSRNPTGSDLRIHNRSPSNDSETQAVLLIGVERISLFADLCAEYGDWYADGGGGFGGTVFYGAGDAFGSDEYAATHRQEISD